MKVMAAEGGSAATWDFSDGDIQLAAVWTEKKKGRGEDAPPTAVSHINGRGILAVYDGAGGAGARPVGRTPENQEVSGAFLASRVTHFALEDWFVTTMSKRQMTDPCDLQDAILNGLRDTGIPPGSKISGTMVRHLPTTLAAIEYEPAGRYVNLIARWAGDSRAYVLDSDEGLQTITRDDTHDSDALVLLANDEPMTNLICADRPFEINEFRLIDRICRPAVLVCATDGFYNYVQSPAHFEHVLLDTMHKTQSMKAWARLLVEAVQSYTSDDASMVIAAFGYPTFDAMRFAFSERHEFLNRRYIQPFREIRPGGHTQLAAARQASWEEYRSGYEKWLRELEARR